MANTAIVNLITGDVYGLYINGKYIVGDTFSRVDAVKQRLNYIFADPNRDLDFITPSYENGQYVISCPHVRRNVGQVTSAKQKNAQVEQLHLDIKVIPIGENDKKTCGLEHIHNG